MWLIQWPIRAKHINNQKGKSDSVNITAKNKQTKRTIKKLLNIKPYYVMPVYCCIIFVNMKGNTFHLSLFKPVAPVSQKLEAEPWM